jgi:hypothetical protein
MNILKWDDSIVNSLSATDLVTYKETLSNYAVVPFRVKILPLNAWAMPYVIGKKYKIHWGHGIDYTNM